jgi:hypothetical protein
MAHKQPMTAALSPPRRHLARLAWALAFVLLLVVPALATTKRPVAVTCPVCDHGFTAFSISSTNTFGGIDFDFCEHARGEPPNSHWVWACPSCRYAAWADDFEEEIEEDERRALRAALDAGLGIKLPSDQREIPGRDKYTLLLQVLEHRGADKRDLAIVALLGAWVERLESPYAGDRLEKFAELRAAWNAFGDEFQSRMEALDGNEQSGLNWPRRKILVATETLAEPADEDAPRNAMDVLRLRAASMLRSRGENALAAPALHRLADADGVHPTIRAIARDLLAGIEHETRLQARWLAYAKSAYDAGEWTGPDAGFRAHQIADTHRRLGQTDEARAWYERALRDPHVPATVFDVTRECLERWCGNPISDEDLAALRAARIATLLDQLEDPETARSAHRSLRVLSDPSTLPRVVAALAHEDETVRAYAALTLKYMPELPDEGIDALCKVLEEDFDDPEENAAAALLENGSPRARAAFLVGIDSSTRRTQELCARGLGMTGEAEDVPRLLELVETYSYLESDVCEALTLLTCRQVEKIAAFRTWWVEHANETRADWTLAVFATHGATLEGADVRTRQRRLIELLESEDVPLRCAALRKLRELTGRSFGWDPLTNDATYPRVVQERRMAVDEWLDWWRGE